MNQAVLRTATSFNSRFTTTRLFSTSIRLSLIGPESPKFIEIPQPPQQRAPGPRIIRGTLPPPRDVFASGKDKTSPKYLQETIPEPSKTAGYARDGKAAWKRQMAVTRRRNLEEGLTELDSRRRKRDNLMRRSSQEKMQRRDEMVYGVPRPDEVLTSSTVNEAVHWFQNGPLPDPDREARIAAKVSRVQAKEVEREAERRDALHSLYMHARSFITTEAQLNAEIERVFEEFAFVISNEEGKEAYDNIWDAKSAPPTTVDMLPLQKKSQKKAFDYYSGHEHTTGKRVLRIAEELTGGKMDV